MNEIIATYSAPMNSYLCKNISAEEFEQAYFDAFLVW